MLQSPASEQQEVRVILDDGLCKASSAVHEDDVASTASTEPMLFSEVQDTLDDSSSDIAPVSFTPLETIVFFDWDDTLMPTTWLQQTGLVHNQDFLNKAQEEALQLVEERATMLLSKAKEYGRVVIVTNAQEGWVELSCKRFTPGLLPVLRDVRVVSARSTYEEPGVFEPSAWKVKAFRAEADAFYRGRGVENMRRNVLSFGDSAHEVEALLALADSMPECRAKTIKFMERPDPSQLVEEHDFLLQSLGEVVDHDGNIDSAISPD